MNNILKTRTWEIPRFILILSILLLFSTSCSTEAETPVPLPTAKVPSLFEINSAIDRWEGGNNQDYFIAVEETNDDGVFLYRVVVADGEIRAAQRLEKVDREWQQPVTINKAAAEKYTVDALLTRILQDANGEGPAPVNMFAAFDPISGFPTVVDAKSIPSYTEDGKLSLNREFSYSLSVSIEILIEQTFGLDKTPLLTVYLSGGADAFCSTLRIFTDGNSIYSDDCRQTLLQLRPPNDSFSRLTELAETLSRVEDIRINEEWANIIVLHATGAAEASQEETDALWDLALELNQLLSKPIGAGVTLLRFQNETLVGFDMRANLQQPSSLEYVPPFHGGVMDTFGQRLIFADSEGLHWLDTLTGESGTYTGNSGESWFVPQNTTPGGKIILRRTSGNGETTEWGWLSAEERSWQQIAPAENCIASIFASPVDERIAVISLTADPCESSEPVYTIDLETGDTTIVIAGPESVSTASWSPDGSKLAVILEQTTDSDESYSILYQVNSDGTGGANITENTNGNINGVVWGQNVARLYYSIDMADTQADGLYEFNLEAGEVSKELPGSGLIPLKFDPNGEFLAFWQETELLVWSPVFGQVVPVTQGIPGESLFIGWVDAFASK